MYIYELEKWPQFDWDQKTILNSLIQLRHHQGRLIGGMESIGFYIREKAVLQTLTTDIVKTSEIEGEILNKSLVRSSVARRLGIESAGVEPIDRNIEGVVEMMLDATQNFDQALTKKRLLNWHASLFPTGRSGFTKIRVGAWRKGPVQVVSGYMGKEIVHYEALAADRVNDEMDLFLNWLNNEETIDLVLKAALAHLWFITIHPFDDGNGRIGRAIADLLLARSEKSSQRFYSLSAQIQKERKNYYAILEKTQKGSLDITSWLKWFFACMERAIEKSLKTLKSTVIKSNFWDGLSEKSLNDRQRKVINLMLEEFKGNLTSSKWAKINNCSQDTAYRDILDLMEQGILIKNLEGGRNTSYSLVLPEDE